MAYTIGEYCDVPGRAAKLGIALPSGLAFLPRNFLTAESGKDLVYEDAVSTVGSLFRQGGVEVERLGTGSERIPVIQENEFALFLPTLAVSALILTQNPYAVTLALNIMSNYATEFFRGIYGRQKVVLDVVVERSSRKMSKRIHYEGDPGGLSELERIVREVSNEQSD